MGNQPSGHHNGDTQGFWSSKSLSEGRDKANDNLKTTTPIVKEVKEDPMPSCYKD